MVDDSVCAGVVRLGLVAIGIPDQAIHMLWNAIQIDTDPGATQQPMQLCTPQRMACLFLFLDSMVPMA